MEKVETIVGALESTAERVPGNLAFRFRDAQVTFAELEKRSRHVAQALLKGGVKPGDSVGIHDRKSMESMLAAWGILRAGAAFVPCDPSLPGDRLAFMIEDCSIRHMFTSSAQMRGLKTLPEKLRTTVRLYGVDDGEAAFDTVGWDEIGSSHEIQGLPKPEPTDIAYIMYTSGSTGAPKGIVHTHASGLAYARAAVESFDVHENDRLSGFPPLHFDQATFHLFAGVLAGALTVLIPDEYGSFPVDLGRLIEQEGITIWYSVPHVLIQLLTRGDLENCNLGALRWVKFGGEAFPPKFLAALMRLTPECRYSNIYGPAEVNQCTHHVLDGVPAETDIIPIGKPWKIADTRVVGPEMEDVAAGESGELLVCTSTMMRGYWSRPDLDERAFHRPQGEGGPLYYRTGDLVRSNDHGELEFLGRMDRQVKTRGYRVELDEVEAAILTHPAVHESAVYLVPGPDNSRVLEAAVIPRSGAELKAGAMLQHLAPRLARYAIPVNFRFDKEFPRTGSGKIDRLELARQATEAAERTNA